MVNFSMVQRVKLVYGNGAINQLGDLVLETNHSKVLIVCDKGTLGAGIVKRATDSLDEKNIPYIIFDEVIPDPPIYLVEKGTKVCEENGCDMVVGIGGGSSIDTAKAINVLRFNDGPIERFADMGLKMNDTEGMVAVPTTAGTGSEVSDGIILTDTTTDKKFPILHPENAPEYAIVDPELMLSMPRNLTASTGMDVLAHAMEGYSSNIANGYSDLICEKLIETVIDYLPAAVNDGSNLEARGRMASAATLAGWMLINVHAHLGHAIAHTIGTMFHIPHGYAVSYALPYAMEHVAPAIPEKIKNLIRMFGREVSGHETPEELGSILKELIYEFAENVGITPKLPEKRDHSFEEVAEGIVTEIHTAFAHIKMTNDDAIKALESMFEKDLTLTR